MSNKLRHFITGIGQVIDMGGTMGPQKPGATAQEETYSDIEAAFEEVGDDLYEAALHWRQKIDSQTEPTRTSFD